MKQNIIDFMHVTTVNMGSNNVGFHRTGRVVLPSARRVFRLNSMIALVQLMLVVKILQLGARTDRILFACTGLEPLLPRTHQQKQIFQAKGVAGQTDTVVTGTVLPVL